MGRVNLEAHELDAVQCQIFVENLVGIALECFSKLEPNSISSFDQLTAVFLKHLSMFIDTEVSIAMLHSLQQITNESLREFIARFESILSRLTEVSDETTIAALMSGLWYRSKFREYISVNRYSSIKDVLHCMNNWICVEEERDSLAAKFDPVSPISKGNAAPKNN